jgi:hypothetical protein
LPRLPIRRPRIPPPTVCDGRPFPRLPICRRVGFVGGCRRLPRSPPQYHRRRRLVGASADNVPPNVPEFRRLRIPGSGLIAFTDEPVAIVGYRPGNADSAAFPVSGRHCVGSAPRRFIFAFSRFGIQVQFDCGGSTLTSNLSVTRLTCDCSVFELSKYKWFFSVRGIKLFRERKYCLE